MGRIRVVVVSVAALAGSTLAAGPAASAPAAPRHDVTVAVPMQCSNGEARTINVSAHLPRQVRAGRAFVVSGLTTDVPLEGSAHLALSNTTPGALAVGTPGPSTLQLVAGSHPGDKIEVTVTSASYVVPGRVDPRPTPGFVVTCTPAAPVRLGKIAISRGGRRPTTPTNLIDADLGTEFRAFETTTFQGFTAHIGFTVPTQLVSGETFALPDLAMNLTPDFGGGIATDTAISAAGTDQALVTPTSVLTVTAQPGQTVVRA